MTLDPALTALIGETDTDLAVATIGTTRLIVFNRPAKRNALTRDMRRRFACLIAEAEADPKVACIVLAGAGACFTAGSDMQESRADPGPLVRPNPGEAVRGVRTPVIAAVDGPCYTGGLEIALSCTFVIATDRSRFADTHAKIGLFPAWGLSALLPRAIGVRRARQMALTGEPLDAATALAWGLANELVAPDRLIARCLEIAAAVAAGDPRAIRWQLAAIDDGQDLIFRDALAAEDAAIVRWRAGEPDYIARTIEQTGA